MKVTTSGSSEGVEIVKDKSKIDIDRLKYKFNNLLQEWNSIYYYCLCRGYKDIKPRIIIEEYVEQSNGDLYDYKLWCFNGEVKYIWFLSERNTNGLKMAFYDKAWNKQDFVCNYPLDKKTMAKPENLDEMIAIAEKLSKEFPHVRVDFYNINNKLYVGEMTFTSGGGFMRFNPIKWDYKIGEWLDLNKLPKEYVNVLPQFKKKENGIEKAF